MTTPNENQAHSAEPWKLEEVNNFPTAIIRPDGQEVTSDRFMTKEDKARTVSCVNFCTELADEFLNHHSLKGMMEFADSLKVEVALLKTANERIQLACDSFEKNSEGAMLLEQERDQYKAAWDWVQHLESLPLTSRYLAVQIIPEELRAILEEKKTPHYPPHDSANPKCRCLECCEYMENSGKYEAES